MAVRAVPSGGELFDLAIVGGGVSGLTCARRAQQLGQSVIVLETSEAGPGMGNGRLSAGWFHALYGDPTASDPDDLFRRLMAETDGCARPDVARAWADNVGRAFRFLVAEGAEFGVLAAPDGPRRNVLAPFRPAGLGRHWQDFGPDRLLTRMHQRFEAEGGAYLARHRALDLYLEDGRVAGVEVAAPAGVRRVRARRVAICDGGFQADADLVRTHITGAYKLRGSSNDRGDGLRMGLRLGALTTGMDRFYGHPLCRAALSDDRLWPFPSPTPLIAAGVLVDGRGRRFVDEQARGEILANAIARCETPQDCWAVFDARAWEVAGRSGEVPVNPVLPAEGGRLVRGDSLESVAVQADLPVDAVVESVRAANAGLPPAPGPSARPWEPGSRRDIADPPFYALPVIAGVTFTMGGLAVNGRAEVLGAGERPLPGLYAAGGAMGGLQGGPRVAVAGGWSEAVTFGLIAAESAARSLAAS